MKTIAQVFLSVFFLIFFSVALISATVKFDLLNYNFWVSTLRTHDVYTKLSDVIKTSVDSQVKKEGGNVKDITILTDLITPENTQDFTEENLLNFTKFINSKTPELKVYVPVSKVPTGLLPKTFNGVQDEMTINDLQTKFGITGLDQLPLKNINKTGLVLYYSLLTAVIFMVLTLAFTVILIDPGKRLIAPGMQFLLSGFIALSGAQFLTKTLTLFNSNSLDQTNMNTEVLKTLLTPIINNLSVIWNYVGVGAVLLGILLFFVKKPGLNKVQ